MESLIKQRRVRFSSPPREESDITQERTVQSEVSKMQDWFWLQFPRQTSPEYDSRHSDLAVAVGAAAFSIHSLEEAEMQRRNRTRENSEQLRIRIVSEKDGMRPSSSRSVRRSFSREVPVKDQEETSGRKSTEQDRLSRQPSRQASTRCTNPAAEDHSLRGVLSRRNSGGSSRADTWERTRLEKINKQYQKLRSSIQAWESEKKLEAKLKIEKRKDELETRKKLNQLHYQNKVSRIDHIAEGARKQAEEKRRSEESQVREKAKRIRSTGKEPVTCFCFGS